jgi:hypothetical protein
MEEMWCGVYVYTDQRRGEKEDKQILTMIAY